MRGTGKENALVNLGNIAFAEESCEEVWRPDMRNGAVGDSPFCAEASVDIWLCKMKLGLFCTLFYPGHFSSLAELQLVLQTRLACFPHDIGCPGSFGVFQLSPN